MTDKLIMSEANRSNGDYNYAKRSSETPPRIEPHRFTAVQEVVLDHESSLKASEYSDPLDEEDEEDEEEEKGNDNHIVDFLPSVSMQQ